MITAIILAAGSGKRVGADVNKLYLPINGKPLLQYTLEQFAKVNKIDEIIVVIGKSDKALFERLLDDISCAHRIRTCFGGETRQESVKNALAIINCHTEYVLIHDGARPYIHPDDIRQVCAMLKNVDAVVLARKVYHTVKLLGDTENEVRTYPREKVVLAETPQGFQINILESMYTVSDDMLKQVTDDSQLLEMMGKPPTFVYANYCNDKITTFSDVVIFAERQVHTGTPRVGIGYDIHQLVAGRKLVIGGVEISYNKGLQGHSDADVLSHAVADALLGAAGLSDIGHYFSDKDARWKDVSSLVILNEVRRILQNNGYSIYNVDIALIAEEPRLSGYINEMKKRLSETLQISVDKIGIKVTTNEKIDDLGKGYAIAAFATASIVERMY